LFIHGVETNRIKLVLMCLMSIIILTQQYLGVFFICSSNFVRYPSAVALTSTGVLNTVKRLAAAERLFTP